MPSMKMVPSVSSTSLKRETNNELFPLPVRPTMPILSWTPVLNDTLCKAGSSSGRYFNVTLSKHMRPSEGQLASGLFSGISYGFSTGVCVAISDTRSTLVNRFSVSAAWRIPPAHC